MKRRSFLHFLSGSAVLASAPQGLARAATAAAKKTGARRIAVGGVAHETNSFSAEVTDIAAFRRNGWYEGQEVLSRNKGVSSYIGGMIDEAGVIGAELLPTFYASTPPSDLIQADTWTELRARMISGLKSVAPFDAICLSLHGAGSAENSLDIEGDLLSAVRAEFGYDIPIAVTLDLHGNITQRMVDNADFLFGVMQYPHIDAYDRGREAVKSLDKMLKGEINPKMVIVTPPMIIPTTTTFFGPAKTINDRCAVWEGKPGVIDCTFFHGFPYVDAPHIGPSVVAIADGDIELARAAAQDVADLLWSTRESFHIKHPGAEEGFKQALASPQKPVLINETSDNPGAGGPGDGTHLLKVMIEKNEPGTVFFHIADPETVAAAHAAGKGKEINIKLGGKTDTLHAAPLPVKATVVNNTVADYISSGPMGKGGRVFLGKSTLLRIGNVDVVVAERKAQALNVDMLTLHGLEMKNYRVLAIKSSHHYRGFFQTAVPKIVTVDTPGVATFDFSTFNFKSPIKYK
jgi:microcystin degradation protein MlrC